MNVDSWASEISPAVWERPEMRRALADRDLKTVYERLQHAGVSQRRIAGLTGQSPSEVYEVVSKGRRIMAYDLLVRIADGLGVPRGYMGLAYDHTTEVALDLAVATCSTSASERDEVRTLLSHAANVTMGTTVDDVASWWQPIDRETAPAPATVGLSDVESVRALTTAMRALDYRHGGGACRDAVAAHARWSQQLLNAHSDQQTRRQLLVALADLHNLAGWTSFDVGMYRVARRHFARALEQATTVNDHSLAANVLYRMGRLQLHIGMTLKGADAVTLGFKPALSFFQLGQLQAQNSGCTVTVSMLCANEGWAYALLGDREQMHRSLGRAEDEFARADHHAHAWVRFFGEADLNASIGVAQTALPDSRNAELDSAIEHITKAIDLRGPDMTRSRIFEQIALATAQLRRGDHDHGLLNGQQAVATAATVRSIRTVDRLAPLRAAADRHRPDARFRNLVEQIDAVKVPA